MPIDEVAKVAADPNISQIDMSSKYLPFDDAMEHPVPLPKGDIYTYDGALTQSLQSALKQNATTVLEYVKFLDEASPVTLARRAPVPLPGPIKIIYSAIILIHQYRENSGTDTEWVAIISSIPELGEGEGKGEEEKVIVVRLDYRTFDIKGIDTFTYRVEKEFSLEEVTTIMEEELRLHHLIPSEEDCEGCRDLTGSPCQDCSVHKENVQLLGEHYLYSVAGADLGGTIIVNKYTGIPIFLATTGREEGGRLITPQPSPLSERGIFIPFTEIKGRVGQEIRVPIKIQNMPIEIHFLILYIIYDKNAFEFTGLEKSELTESLDVKGGDDRDTIFSDLNQLQIVMIDIGEQGQGIPKGASGDLAWMKFKIKTEEEGRCYAFQFHPTHHPGPYEEGGCLCIQKCDEDLNEDGQVTPEDALIAFRCYLESGPCLECSDVDKNGMVTPQDALCILQKYLGAPSCLDEG
ncbi:MAG: hypothetical protein AB1847_14305 [bacterium]